MDLWRWLISWLVWLSADPAAVDLERPRAAAAVAAARASLAVEAPAPAPKPPAPGPKPPTPAVCAECGGRGYLVMPDGHRIACGACGGKGCRDGKCATPEASPATASSARPAGGR